jgi:ABC-type transport system substrate-binding protein
MRKDGKAKSLTIGSAVAAAALSMAVGVGVQVAPTAAAAAANQAFCNTPTYGGTLTMPWSNDFATLDPVYWDDGQSLMAMQSIYDTLVEYNKDSTVIGPGLATHWTVSNGGLTYTFFLRNAKFSNGDPVTAADVAFNLDRVSQPGANSPYAAFTLGDVQGYAALQKEPKTSRAYTQWSSNPMPLSGVKVLGPHELSITLVKPEAFFLNDLALMVTGVADPAVVKQYGPTDANDAYENHAVGSGPFKLLEWQHNKQLVLVPNPLYWGPKPYLAKVVFPVNVNATTEYEQFTRDQVNLIWGPTSAQYLQAMSNPQTAIEFHQQPYNWVVYGYFDTSKPPFNNLYLRQALNYAVSKRVLIKVAVNGHGYLPNDGVLPPGMPGWVNSKEPYPYNLAKAKALMAKAGYAHKTLSFKYYIPNDPTDAAIATYLQQAWRKIGVNIQIVPVSTSVYWTNASPPGSGGPQTSYDAGDAGWVQDYPDPSDFFANLLTATGPANNPKSDVFASSNESNYNNPKVDQLVNEADSLPPSQDALRYKLFDQAQAIVEHDAPWLFMYFGTQEMLITSNVGPSDINLYLHPIKAVQFQYIWVCK